MDEDHLTTRGERHGSSMRAELVGELDMSSAPRARDALMSAVASSSHVVIDLEHLGFMDSTGLALLVAVKRECDRRTTTVDVVNPTRQVRRLLQVSGVDRALAFGDGHP